MRASQRVLINTLAQYVRVFVSMFLSLYTVRIVLHTLGSNDFGIYSIVAGVVSMLAFVTNALVQTTQRYVSYYQGMGDAIKLKEVFCSSLVIHIVLGLIIVIALEALTPFIFDGVLQIPTNRMASASAVYQTVVGMLFISFVTSPYRALLISHENIVFISIIDIIDIILKLGFALLLTKAPFDRLIFYGISMCLVQIFNFSALSFHSYRKYEECIIPHLRFLRLACIKSLFSFAGWNVYSTACIVGRQQGVAIVVNRMLGIWANAAYGIAFQLSSYTSFLSASLVTAIAPQIMKAEGAGDRQRALWLSCVVSKFSFFLLSAVCVPCMFEMDEILRIWLGNPPDGSNVFCIMVLMTIVVDAVTGGLGHINQAVGNIKWYCILMNTPKLVTIPLIWFIFKNGDDIFVAACSYVMIEAMCTWTRAPFVSRTAGLNVPEFLKDVVLKEICPIFALLLTCFCCVIFLDFPYRFLFTFLIAITVYFVSIWGIGLTVKEKQILLSVAQNVLRQIRR